MYKNDKINVVITSEQERYMFPRSQHQASGRKWKRAPLFPAPPEKRQLHRVKTPAQVWDLGTKGGSKPRVVEASLLRK